MSPNLTTSSSVHDLIRAYPSAAGLLKECGIHAECCGCLSLEEAAHHAGVDPECLLETALCWATPLPNPPARNWSAAPLPQLIDHIVSVHHEYLRRQLPRIRLLLDKAIKEHGDRLPQLHTLRDRFRECCTQLRDHLVAEEDILFPAIRSMEHPELGFVGEVDFGSAAIMHDNRAIVGVLAEIASEARALAAGLSRSTLVTLSWELDLLLQETREHEALEDDNLFPRALALQRSHALE